MSITRRLFARRRVSPGVQVAVWTVAVLLLVVLGYVAATLSGSAKW